MPKENISYYSNELELPAPQPKRIKQGGFDDYVTPNQQPHEDYFDEIEDEKMSRKQFFKAMGLAAIGISTLVADAKTGFVRNAVERLTQEGLNQQEAYASTMGSEGNEIIGTSIVESDDYSDELQQADKVWDETQSKPIGDKELEILKIKSLPETTTKKLDKIRSKTDVLKPLYKEAGQQTGLPWPVIAALHYREADNEPGHSAWAGEKLGSKNPDTKEIMPSDQLANYISAGEHLKKMAKMVYGIELNESSSLEDYGNSFLAFNRGFMYKNAEEMTGDKWTFEKSAYVMSGLTQDRVGMRWADQGHYNGGKKGDTVKSNGEPESVQGEIEPRPGALAVMIYHGFNPNK